MGSCKLARHVEGPQRPDTFEGRWHLSPFAIAERKAANKRRSENIERAFLRRKREKEDREAKGKHELASFEHVATAHRIGQAIRNMAGPMLPKRYQGRGS